MIEEWYTGSSPKTLAQYYNAGIPGKIDYKTDNPKQEFIEYLVTKHILPETNIDFDPVNYLHAGETYPPLPEKYESVQDYLQAFRAVSKPGTAFFRLVNDYNSNIVYIRIRKNDGDDRHAGHHAEGAHGAVEAGCDAEIAGGYAAHDHADIG